ncbi:MAG: hypothetical protein KF857_04775 [Fimbriimonadaceae bacterium]|nr:hypothetical protein [Fimbriimonadaceae bacterium]
MPLETSQLKCAEKVLVLTHALLAAARRGDWDDFAETLRARESAILSLASAPLDRESAAVLEAARSCERAVEQAIAEAQGDLVGEMAAAYRDRRGLARYAASGRQGGLLDSRG